MPTTAIKTFNPTEFMNHTVGDGIRPKVGFTERSHPKNSPENQRAAGGRQRERHTSDLVDDGADESADGDRSADKCHIGHIGGAICDTQHLGARNDVLRAANKSNDVAPL